MKTSLRVTKLSTKLKLRLLLLIVFAIASNSSKALISSYGLTTASATLDPMSGGTITTLVSTSINDGASPVTAIGFSFSFNGTTYTQFSVNSNGNMRLGATVIGTTATNSIAGGTDFPRISPYWDDLKTVAGTVRSKVLGSSPTRTLVVDWNVTVVSTNQAIQFQAWLFEGTNNIQFVYGAGINANAGLYSIGLTTSASDYSSITVASTFASSTASSAAANNSNTLAIGASNSFLYMPAPACPVYVAPVNAATGVSKTPTLSWTAGATGTTQVYDVYFGTAASPPLVSGNQVGLSYSPPTLLNNTQYFWKVNGKNGSIVVSTSASCTTRSFTTIALPNCASNLAPANLSTNLATTTTLSWTAGAGTTPTGYDVYFGTLASPPIVSTDQAGTTYNPGALSPNTTYFWKVIPKNGTDQASGCSTFQFTTRPLPNCVTNISPANLATNVNLETTLTWTAGAGTVPTGYNVYFGTVTNPPLVSSNQAALSYNPGFLAVNNTYYWKVVALDGSGQAVGCSENRFTTRGALSYEVTRSTGISFTSISSTGSSVPSWRNGTDTDDNLSNALSIGFNFVYDGATYTSFLVDVNGFITFNTGTAATGSAPTPYGYQNSSLEHGTPVSPKVLAPFWDDITCQGGGSDLQINLNNCIKYQTTGSSGSKVLTVEWIGMETFTYAGPNLNFQVKLYEGTNKIEFLYGSMDGFDGAVTPPLPGPVYGYSVGMNANNISSVGQPGEYLEQQIANTRSFASTAQNQLNATPECFSKLTFTPGAYTAYVPVSLLPVNDSIGNPVHLSVNPTPCFELCGNIYKTAGATPSPKAVACGGTADDDVWFDFIANNANTTIKVSGSGSFDPTVELFNSSLTSIACANNNGAGLSETINSTTLVPGNKYVVRVYHRGTGYGSPGSGEFSICVSGTPSPPLNDNCANAIALPISATMTQGTNTYAATASTAPACGLSGGENPDDDVWYSFVAQRTIEVITVSGANGFNAVIQLLNGSCGFLNPIQCKNSFGNGQVETMTATNLTIGGNYYVRVYHAGVGGGSGNFSISVSSPAPICSDLILPPDNEPNMSASGIDLIWDPIIGADNYKVLFDTINPPVHVLGVTTDTTIFTGILQPDETYYWQMIPGNGNSYNTSCGVTKFMTEERPIALKLKTFLQELYLTNRTMKTVLNPADTIADTLEIDLYDDLQELQYSSFALLSTNGLATGYFPLIALDSPYYFVVKHRNSLETWSSTQFNLSETTTDTVFDFSSSPSSVWGGNVVQVQAGVYALYCGDVNQDGYINYLDVGTVGDTASLFIQGYNSCDINADSTVESLDLSIIENLAPRSKRTPFPPFGP
jgi:hypothetical protein